MESRIVTMEEWIRRWNDGSNDGIYCGDPKRCGPILEFTDLPLAPDPADVKALIDYYMADEWDSDYEDVDQRAGEAARRLLALGEATDD